MTTRPPASAGPTSALARPGELRRAAAVERLRVNMGAVVPRPPTPGERGSEWRTWDADLPAVTAAIEALDHTLALERWSTAPPLHWHSHEQDLELWIDVTVSARGDVTEVGLKIAPAGTDFAGPGLTRNVAVHAAIATAAVLFTALFLVGSGDAWVLILIGLIDLVFTLCLVFGLVVIPARRLALAQAEWSRTWRRNFWAALEARIRQGALYR